MSGGLIGALLSLALGLSYVLGGCTADPYYITPSEVAATKTCEDIRIDKIIERDIKQQKHGNHLLLFKSESDVQEHYITIAKSIFFRYKHLVFINKNKCHKEYRTVHSYRRYFDKIYRPVKYIAFFEFDGQNYLLRLCLIHKHYIEQNGQHNEWRVSNTLQKPRCYTQENFQ